MSELTADPTPQRQPRLQTVSQADYSMSTPLRTRFEDMLNSVGWKSEDLTADQFRLLAGLVADRQKLLDMIQTLNENLEKTRQEADLDPLLHIYNRRAFLRELNRQLSFCFRYETPACLIYLDLDRFKEINDRYGHSTGDIALRKFGEVLVAHTRGSDIVGRLGGDEFAVLLINATLQDAQHKADMFREDVQKVRVLDVEPPISFGLSCGVVSWNRGEPAEQLLHRGDEAMYMEKRQKHRSPR